MKRLLSLLLVLASSRSAFASELTYTADVGCPSRDEVNRRVTEKKAPRARDAQITVRHGATGFNGEVVVGTGESAIERHVQGQSCTAVLDALLLVLALNQSTASEPSVEPPTNSSPTSSHEGASAPSVESTDATQSNSPARRLAAAPPASDIDGLRFSLGAFALAHWRRPVRTALVSALDSWRIVPGLALGIEWRRGSWAFDVGVRGAYYYDPHMFWVGETKFLAAGGGARWFFYSGSLSPYFDLGFELLHFGVDSYAGLSPAAHLGGGIELRHDRAHHRFRFELGVDVPAFAVSSVEPVGCLADSGAICPSPKTETLYLVPVSLGATWIL